VTPCIDVEAHKIVCRTPNFGCHIAPLVEGLISAALPEQERSAERERRRLAEKAQRRLLDPS
jgi:hypothetical protein